MLFEVDYDSGSVLLSLPTSLTACSPPFAPDYTREKRRAVLKVSHQPPRATLIFTTMQIQDVMVSMLSSQGREGYLSRRSLTEVWSFNSVYTLVDNVFWRHTLGILCGPYWNPGAASNFFFSLWSIDPARCQKCSKGILIYTHWTAWFLQLFSGVNERVNIPLSPLSLIPKVCY